MGTNAAYCHFAFSSWFLPFFHYFPKFAIILSRSIGSVVRVCRRAVSFHSMNTTNTTNTTIISTSPQKPQQRSGSLHNKSSVSPSPNNNSQRRSINLAQVSQAVKCCFFYQRGFLRDLIWNISLNILMALSLSGSAQISETARCQQEERSSAKWLEYQIPRH